MKGIAARCGGTARRGCPLLRQKKGLRVSMPAKKHTSFAEGSHLVLGAASVGDKGAAAWIARVLCLPLAPAPAAGGVGAV